MQEDIAPTKSPSIKDPDQGFCQNQLGIEGISGEMGGRFDLLTDEDVVEETGSLLGKRRKERYSL